MAKTIRCMFIGDLVGRPGREMFQKWARRLQTQYKIDAIIVNGENAADNGRGITSKIVTSLLHSGANAITSGNHIWAQQEIISSIESHPQLLRPANFPSACPGKGHYIFEVAGTQIAIMNIQGRVFMHEHLDSPFRTAETLLSLLKTKTKIIFLDFHAETTSEKKAMSFFLDGSISGMVGTHTHVQTADEQILPGGTAYITDLGCSSALYSSIGMNKDSILTRYLTQMPSRFSVDLKGPFQLTGVWIEVDVETGKATAIERIKVVDEELTL